MSFSITKLNRLAPEIREPLYLQLVPASLYDRLVIDPRTLTNQRGQRVVQGIFPPDDNFACIEIKENSEDKDWAFACQVSLDTFMYSVHLDFVTINDPRSTRYDLDIDESGCDTLFGCRSRNIGEELRAMNAGLAPGMVRRGLGILGEFVERLETFTASVGLKAVTLGALYYHNAISWERYGFTYFRGLNLMKRIHEEFHPRGLLHRCLDNSTPFRRPGMEGTVRGRSWAIHDGILVDAFDDDWHNPKMYKMVGRHHGVNTFPDHTY